MPLPCLIAKGVSHGASPAEVYTPVPVPVRRILPVFLNVLESKEFPSGVVEHAVHHHADACLMACFYEMTKAVVVTKAAVHQFVIPGVIAVGGRFE